MSNLSVHTVAQHYVHTYPYGVHTLFSKSTNFHFTVKGSMPHYLLTTGLIAIHTVSTYINNHVQAI